MDEYGKEVRQRDAGIYETNRGSSGYSQTEDVVLKTMMQYFQEELLPYLGIKKRAVGIAPTENVYLEVRKLLQDFNLIMEDGSWSHFEFQSKNGGMESLKRFRMYEAVASYQHKVEVTTYVLFSGTIRNPMVEFTEGLNTYRIHPVIMQSVVVEELLDRLQEKVALGIKLSKEDLVPLTLCPLMGGKMSQKERIKKAFEFSRQVEKSVTKQDIEKIEAVIYAMAEKFLEEVDMREVREAIKMTKLGQMLVNDGIEEGRDRSLIALVLKKLRKSYTVPEIADMLEEKEEVVQKIYNIVAVQTADYDENQIYEEFHRQNTVQ